MPVFADHLTTYKYCHTIYQALQTRHMNIDRLQRTIHFHDKAYQQYKNQQKLNLANFHKQHHAFLQHMVHQQQHYFKKEKNKFNLECENHLNDFELRFNDKLKQLPGI